MSVSAEKKTKNLYRQTLQNRDASVPSQATADNGCRWDRNGPPECWPMADVYL